MIVTFCVNGRQVAREADPTTRAIDLLRDSFHLAGVKEGCGEGECGACSILLDGRLVNSCLLSVGQLHGKRILTIEGFRKTEGYRMLEEAFSANGAVQCGFCTPGFIMAAVALLSSNPDPSESDIREGISGNLCRCTGYDAIVSGILEAARVAAGTGADVWKRSVSSPQSDIDCLKGETGGRQLP